MKKAEQEVRKNRFDNFHYNRLVDLLEKHPRISVSRDRQGDIHITRRIPANVEVILSPWILDPDEDETDLARYFESPDVNFRIEMRNISISEDGISTAHRIGLKDVVFSPQLGLSEFEDDFKGKKGQVLNYKLFVEMFIPGMEMLNVLGSVPQEFRSFVHDRVYDQYKSTEDIRQGLEGVSGHTQNLLMENLDNPYNTQRVLNHIASEIELFSPLQRKMQDISKGLDEIASLAKKL